MLHGARLLMVIFAQIFCAVAGKRRISPCFANKTPITMRLTLRSPGFPTLSPRLTIRRPGTTPIPLSQPPLKGRVHLYEPAPEFDRKLASPSSFSGTGRPPYSQCIYIPSVCVAVSPCAYLPCWVDMNRASVDT